MKRTVIFIVKDVLTTQLMHQFDVFERFKFVGMFFFSEQEQSHHHMTAQELLNRAVRCDKPWYATVGVIIPEVGAAFVPGHTVYSDGHRWSTVRDICEAYNAPLPEAA